MVRRLHLLVLAAVLGLGGTRGADQESGTELFLYTLWDPAALCNDGSQAGFPADVPGRDQDGGGEPRCESASLCGSPLCSMGSFGRASGWLVGTTWRTRDSSPTASAT